MARRNKCNDIHDIYMNIPREQRVVDEKTFGRIVKTYFRCVVDALFERSEAYLPCGMGMLRMTIVDLTPSYDTKSGKITGWFPKKPTKYRPPNKIVKVSYYKCRRTENPFRMFSLLQGSYIRQKKKEVYTTGQFNSLYSKKI